MTPHEKITAIVNDLGISTDIQAKAMKIKPTSVRKKRSLNKDKFTEFNYQDLVKFLRSYLESL